MTRRARFENDWTHEQLKRESERFQKVVTIPINTKIKGDQIVLNLQEARSILEKAEMIVLMDCICRKLRGNCDAPVHTCLRLNERGKKALESDAHKELNPQEITVEEALEVLEKSHRSGLVHLAIAVDQSEINEVCSCCECCCMVLSAIIRFGLSPYILTSTSVASTDEQRCLLCGACTERCQFDAREMVAGSLVMHIDRCIGCGLCVSTCPAQAIKLVKREAPSME